MYVTRTVPLECRRYGEWGYLGEPGGRPHKTFFNPSHVEYCIVQVLYTRL